MFVVFDITWIKARNTSRKSELRQLSTFCVCQPLLRLLFLLLYFADWTQARFGNAEYF